jgi:hypothetical protein
MPPFQIGKQLGQEIVLPRGAVEFAAQRHASDRVASG